MESILKRVSVRQYQNEPISETKLASVNKEISELEPLYPKIRYHIDIIMEGQLIHSTFTGVMKHYAKVYAPQYIAIYSEEKDGYLENAGYLGEQLVLKLTELGIGSCWLGSPINKGILEKVHPQASELEYVILIAIGNPEKALTVKEERKRLSPQEIFTPVPEHMPRELVNALVLAPSAMNSQPWRIFVRDDRWDFYMKKHHFPVNKIIGYYNRIDVGIALYHVRYIAEQLGIFDSLDHNSLSKYKGMEYIHSVKFRIQR